MTKTNSTKEAKAGSRRVAWSRGVGRGTVHKKSTAANKLRELYLQRSFRRTLRAASHAGGHGDKDARITRTKRDTIWPKRPVKRALLLFRRAWDNHDNRHKFVRVVKKKIVRHEKGKALKVNIPCSAEPPQNVAQNVKFE